MKIMLKSKIIDQSKVSNIIREKEILSQIKSDFIVNMSCSFQDFSHLYLVLRLLTGGDLKYHLFNYNKSFTEEMIKFIIINISLCLKFIHQNGIIHRDIKPENFVFDENGYLHLTDFGLSIYKDENSNNSHNTEISDENEEIEDYLENEIVGSLGYIAPEIILGMGKYTTSVDIYALGVISYEFIFLQKPYKGTTRYQIGKEMLEDKINFKNNNNYSEKLIKLVQKLLKINPKERLGAISGINEILENEYINKIIFNEILKRRYNSPFVEIIHYLRNYSSNNKYYELFDIKTCNNSIKLDDETKFRLSQIEADPNYINYFQDYTFIYFENEDLNDINSIIKDNNKTTQTSTITKNCEIICETSSSDNSTYIVYNNLQLPPINQRELRNVCILKLMKYNKLLNKIRKKGEDKNHKKKDKEEREDKSHKNHKKKDKHSKKKHRRHSCDDSSSYDGKPLIINNLYQNNGNNRYNYHPYYQNPFQSIQNNFILPKINPYAKQFKEMYSQMNKNKKKLKDNSTYSKISSSSTYEKLKKLKLKEKDKKSKIDETKEKKNKINSKENTESESVKEKSKNKKEKDKKETKSKENKKDKTKSETEDKKQTNKESSSKSKSSKTKKTDKNKKKKKKIGESEKSEKSEKSSKKESNNTGSDENSEKEDDELTTIKEKTEENEGDSSDVKKKSNSDEKEESNSDDDKEESNSDEKEESENKESNSDDKNESDNSESNSDEKDESD